MVIPFFCWALQLQNIIAQFSVGVLKCIDIYAYDFYFFFYYFFIFIFMVWSEL